MPVGARALVAEFGEQLRRLGWVDALLVAGSLATGDHVPGVSDLDLVALVGGPVGAQRQAALAHLHRRLDRGVAAGAKLGCVYVEIARLATVAAPHPTWTHGELVQRGLSGVTRAELARHGYAVFGPPPGAWFASVSRDDVRAAAHAELAGYWSLAVRRPWWWCNPDLADLGLTSMARARHALATGELLSKTAAIERADAPGWLTDQLRARRSGEQVRSPRLRTAFLAWRDARRTTGGARTRTGRGNGVGRSACAGGSTGDPATLLGSLEEPPITRYWVANPAWWSSSEVPRGSERGVRPPRS